MIIFKAIYNRRWDINGLIIVCSDDIEDWNYELIGTYSDNLEMLNICLRTVFVNPDKKYKLLFGNDLVVKPNAYNEADCGVIDLPNKKILDYCSYKERIISFCLYGKLQKYLKGAIINAKQFKNTYPDSTCYFYVKDDVDTNVLDKIKSFGGEIIHCVNIPDYLFRLTRFLACENIKDYFMCRDVDCRLNERDIVSNKEWLDSPYKFHIVRDHPEHGTKILAGLWGCRDFFVLKNMRIYMMDYLLHAIKNFNVHEKY